MENIFTFNVFLISLPIYIACLIIGYMLAIKPRRDKKNKITSLSNELYQGKNSLKVEKLEDIDIYFELANVFRKNGEFEKAVQLHNKILESHNLPKEIKTKAMLELGKDYLASGLFNHAEITLLDFLKQAEKKSENEYEALVAIAELYERQTNWKQALIYRRKLFNIDKDHNGGLALLLCNVAYSEIQDENIGNAKKLYQEALSIDNDCIIAIKENIKLLISEGNTQEAFNLLESYSNSSYRLLNLLLDAFKYFIQLEDFKEKTVSLLEKLVNDPECDFEVTILYCNYLLSIKENDKLTESIDTYYELHKNKLQAVYTMALFLRDSKFDYKAQDDANILLEKIENMLELGYNYQCSKCGYHTKQEFWHCPQCQQWDTLDRTYR